MYNKNKTLRDKAKKIILLGPCIRKITFYQTKLDIVKSYTNIFLYVIKLVELNQMIGRII